MSQVKESSLYILSSSPFLHSGNTIPAAMRDVLLALVPTLAASVYYFGLNAVSVIVTCCLSTVLTEAACQKIMKRPLTIYDGSALLTGLLLAFCLPAGLPIGIAAFGAAAAIVVGKQVFGGLGNNIFNPAHIGRAILLASFPAQMTTWLKPMTAVTAVTAATAKTSATPVDALTTATPLAVLRYAEKLWSRGGDAASANLPSLTDLFIGNVGGSLGETCVPAILLGGIYLIWRGHIDWRIPIGYLATVAVCTGLYGTFFNYDPYFALYHLMSGGLMIGAFFMATDWVTSPITKRGRLIFAIGLGLITSLIRLRGGYIEGVCYSILIMNMVTPLIDRYITNTSFGGGKKDV